MLIQFWNNRQGKLLLVHNPSKKGSSRTKSKGLVSCKTAIPVPIKYEFARSHFQSQIFAKKSLIFCDMKDWNRVVNISIFKQPIFVGYLMAILRKQDFTSLVFKSYCDRGCFWAKYLSNHFFTNFVVYKHVSVVYFYKLFQDINVMTLT